MEKIISSYEQQAIDFLNKCKVSFNAEYDGHRKHFEDDKTSRDIYKITLKRGRKSISFMFGQSLNNSNGKTKPTAYDLLATCEKYEPEDFDYWCNEFGYNDRPLSDYKKVKKIYDSVVKEWQKVNSFFTKKELEELREIQ